MVIFLACIDSQSVLKHDDLRRLEAKDEIGGAKTAYDAKDDANVISHD